MTRVEPLQDYCWQASILGHATEKAEAARRNLSMRTELNLPSIAAMITAYAKLPPVPDFFYVYELTSDRDSTVRYRGVTRDLRKRLDKHNAGSCSHTSKYRPWHIEFAVAFQSELKARAFEKYLKSGSGREFARRHF